MSRVRNGWLLTGMALGGLALAGCGLKGAPPPDSSAIGTAAVPGRWTAHSVAWKEANQSDWMSYDGVAFGPGSAFPAERHTLRRPDMNTEYLPPIDNPMFGAMTQEEAAGAYKFPAVLVPSENYYVNGVDMGPSPNRQQAGIPLKGQ